MDIGDSIELFKIATEVYNHCKNLNNSYKRYQNHSKYLYDIAEKINNEYKITERSRNKEVPELITRLYNHTIKFQNEVNKLKGKNLMKRIWYLNKSNEKYIALRDELDYIMKEFTIQNFVIADNNKDNKYYNKEMLNRIKVLQNDMNTLKNDYEKNRVNNEEQEKEMENNYLNENLINDKKIAQGMLQVVEDNENNKIEIVNEFKEDEKGCTINTINMIEESKIFHSNYGGFGEKLLGFMHRNSTVSQGINSLPSWFINEDDIEISNKYENLEGSGSYSSVYKGVYNGAVVAKKSF